MTAFERQDILEGNAVPLPGAKAAVIGIGRSGLAAARLLRRRGCEVLVSEARAREELEPKTLALLSEEGISVEAGGHNESGILGCDWIVVSPGVPITWPFLAKAKRKGIEVIGELELGARFTTTPVIAITGTNGKSTVTTLIGELITAAGMHAFVGGNLGTPLCEYVLDGQDADFAVCEVSSFQLDTAPTFRPRIGVLLNITPDHLDRYESFDHYGNAKMSLFRNQEEENVAILNADDPEITRRLPMLARGKRRFYRAHDSDDCHGFLLDGVAMVRTPKEGEMETYDLTHSALASAPNSGNALAAILAARAAGCSPDAIRSGLGGYKVLSHRMALAGRRGGVTYIDDSKATNVGATAAALAGIETPVLLIAGGRDKGGDYGVLDTLIRRKVKVLLLIGEAREKIALAFQGMTRIVECATLEEAVIRAATLASPGDVVLLSPACASFDMFSGYTERGRVFQQAVSNLGG